MIANWLVSNFKSVRDETVLELNPITVIAGANSSGKSTILQSILLISQTLQSRFKKEACVPNGDLVRLGTPAEILNFTQPDLPLKIGCVLDFEHTNDNFRQKLSESELMRPRSQRVVFSVEYSKKKNNTGFDLMSGLYERQGTSGKVRLGFARIPHGTSSAINYRLTETSPDDLLPKDTEGISIAQIFPYEYSFSRSSAVEFGEDIAQLAGQIDSVKVRLDPIESEYNRELSRDVLDYLRDVVEGNRSIFPQVFCEQLLAAKTVSEVLNLSHQLLDEDQDMHTRLRNELRESVRIKHKQSQLINQTRLVPRMFPRPIVLGCEDIRQYFEQQVHYLGPLRDDPRVMYAIPSNLDFRSVGLKGEFTAAMLVQYKNQNVLCPIPSTISEYKAPEIEVLPLAKAVELWLQHMGLVDQISAEEMVNIGYQLKVQQSGLVDQMALTRIGVGVSQVLPTLVMCLLTLPPCTLLIEQPELHLHPKVQSALGDFFLGITYCQKQCIVETHSEHIINRLFLRIAQDYSENEETTELLRRVGIIFVEKEGVATQFRYVKPNEYGSIPDSEWPAGFMDQAVIEAQRKLQAAKGKRISKGLFGRTRS